MDNGKCSREERKAEAHSGMGTSGRMFLTEGVMFSRRGTWEKKTENPEVALRTTKETHIRQLDSSQVEVKILCRGGEKPMPTILTYLEEYR